MIAFPAASELSQITSLEGYRYQITPDDVMWLARSVQYEGDDYLSTCWTYAQRQVLYRRTGSLKTLVQSHSQPINPIWRRDGAKCRPGGPYHGRDECSEARLARRDEAASLPWEQVRPEVQQVIVAFVTGQTDNPVPRATDFADQAVSESFIRRNPGTEVIYRAPGSNWYLAELGAQGWPDGFVMVGGRAGSGGILPWLGVGALFAAAAGIFWWTGRR